MSDNEEPVIIDFDSELKKNKKDKKDKKEKKEKKDKKEKEGEDGDEEVVKEKKVLECVVEKGAPDGEKYVFHGESDQHPDKEAGHVIISVAE